MTTPIMIFDKTYEGFESIADLERDISEMWDDTNIPGEFQGSVRVRAIYAPYVSPCEKLIEMVEYSALPDDKDELLNFLKSIQEK